MKDWIKSGLIVSLLLVLSFSYGHFYQVLNSTVFGEFDIIRHSYMLPVFLIIFIIGVVLIIRTSIRLDKIKTIVNVVAITLIVITIPNFAFSEISISETIDKTDFENIELEYDLKNLDKLNSKIYPDVYYILLDGYGGTKRMKQDLGFDNYDFLLELTKRGFFAPDTSSSNYPSTGWSITSTLNMNYLPVKEKEQSEAEYVFLLSQINQKNEVMRNFDYMDYQISHYQTYSVFSKNLLFVDQILCQKVDNPINSKFNNILLRTSILGFFTSQINLNADRDTVLCAFNELSTLGKKNDKPIFAFIHFLLPHPPYLFGANGENIIGGKTQTVEGSFVDESKYIDSIRFANKKILENIDDILENNKNSIIIIQSDHGYDFRINYENPSEKSLKQRFSILNAIYLPDAGRDEFYQGITPINTFRIIFNNYFDTSYDILEDRMYYRPYGASHVNQYSEFQDVTEIILN